MHGEAKHFLAWVKEQFPDSFEYKCVLDVGAADLNGNNRELFTHCEYVGNDVYPTRNVTIVCPTGELPFPPATFDTIVSSECFEHDMFYAKSLQKVVELLRPGGLFAFTCASSGREEHGTRRTSPHDSLTCYIQQDAWADYYKNLTAEDVRAVLDCDALFSAYAFYYNQGSKDLYFYGRKRTTAQPMASTQPVYQAPHVFETTAGSDGGPANRTLTGVLNKYNTDKNATFHNYGKYYERYFRPYRDKPLRYLEIGVFGGESLRAMREYFHRAERVVGIDSNPEAKQHEDPSRGIFVEIGDQKDPNFLSQVFVKHGPFDIVLDDGSHVTQDVVSSFHVLFPLLQDGGLYVVEDTICIREELGYFQGLVRYLNRWRMDVGGDHCVDPQKIQLKTSNPFEYGIGDVVFSNSCILIHKEVKWHWVA